MAALPPDWRGFEFPRELDDASMTCAGSNPPGREARTEQLRGLSAEGIRFFACDESVTVVSAMPIGYAVRGPEPRDGLDTYLDSLPLAAGRTVVKRQRVQVQVGEMVTQRVREVVPASDGTVRDTTQFQFLIVRFHTLNVLFIEFPSARGETYAETIETFGRTFTPIR